MMRTIMRGEPVIFGRSVLDTCSKKTRDANGKLTRVSLKISQWSAVMQAGLAQYPIGEFVAGSSTDRHGPRIRLFLPKPTDAVAVRRYHNLLMSLANVSFAALAEKMVTVSSKKPRRKTNVPLVAAKVEGDGDGQAVASDLSTAVSPSPSCVAPAEEGTGHGTAGKKRDADSSIGSAGKVPSKKMAARKTRAAPNTVAVATDSLGFSPC